MRAARQLALLVLVASTAAAAGELYEYRDDGGAPIFSDKPPADGRAFARRATVSSPASSPRVTIRVEQAGALLDVWADNGCHCPAEVALQLTGGTYRDVEPDSSVHEVLPALGSARLMTLRPTGNAGPPQYRFGFMFGDPQAQHAPAEAYRPPFAAGREFMVSQAFPDAITHVTPDSRHAIDLAMPEHTDIYAARGGIVVEVAHRNFRGGADYGKYGAEANLVKIMHDDGSFAIYAHLSWDSIRVRPGDRVERGQIIAASGNTGFSSGPHLHFVVVHNEGLRAVSVPVMFSDGRGGVVAPRSGDYLRNP